MKKFQKTIQRNKTTIAVFLAMGVAASLLGAFAVRYFQKLLDDFSGNTVHVSTVILYAAVLVCLCLINYLDNKPHAKLENRIYLDFKTDALEKMESVSFSAYQKLGMGQLLQQVENGASAGRDILFGFFFRMVRELLPNVVFSLCLIALIQVKMMLVLLVGYGIVFLVSNLLLRYLYRIKERILVNEEQFNHYLVRGFMELPVFRINRKLKAELDKTRAASDQITASKTQMVLIHEAFFTIFALLIIAIKIGIILYTLWTRAFTVGELVALVMLIDNAYTPVAIFNVLFVKYKLDQVAFERYCAILALPDDCNLHQGDPISLTQGKVEFSKVSFAYEDREEQGIFDQLSLAIAPNQSTAFVGQSGSGKSTILKLLIGFLKPTGGTIFVDGRDLSKVKLESLYAQISYTAQESPVFDGSLRENILFDAKATEEEIVFALTQVGLQAFYKALPQGLNTPIGEKGVLLSGGERQRLALARLYFQKAKLIILDEATSALDNVTEQQVMKNLLTFLRGKTVILVAHRFNMVREAEEIYVMRGGQIVDHGSYADLIERCAYFQELNQ